MTVIYVAEGSATKMHIPWKFCAFTGSGFTVGEGGGRDIFLVVYSLRKLDLVHVYMC